MHLWILLYDLIQITWDSPLYISRGYIKTEGLQVQALQESLCCILVQDTFILT